MDTFEIKHDDRKQSYLHTKLKGFVMYKSQYGVFWLINLLIEYKTFIMKP